MHIKVNEPDMGNPKAALVNLLSISIYLKDGTHFHEVQRLMTAAILNKDKGQDPGDGMCVVWKKSSQVFYIAWSGDLSPVKNQDSE